MDEASSEDGAAFVGVHRLKTRDGTLLEFEDETRWEMQPGHEVFTDHWSPETEITVVPGGLPHYPYDLINFATGDRVPARYKGRYEPGGSWSLVEDSAARPARRSRTRKATPDRERRDHP